MDEKPQPARNRELSPIVSADASSPIAAFDFDGTLTWTDSFNAFLFDTCGASRMAATAVAHPGLWTDYVRTRDRGALKSRFLYSLLGPVSQAELQDRIAQFVTKRGLSLFRPDALAAWDSHAASGHRRVIVTASPELVVAPLGALIGADRVIGTRLGFSDDGQLRRDLDGINCRGPEKARRLREAFGDGLDLDSAYGDTLGDREMLAAARHAHYRVFHGKSG